MPIPADQMAAAEILLRRREDRVPERVRHMLEVRHRTEGNSILLFEFRNGLMNPGVWHEEMVAKFTYVQSRKCWLLYWMRGNGKWFRYEIPEAASFATLFKEVEADPFGCFWG